MPSVVHVLRGLVNAAQGVEDGVSARARAWCDEHPSMMPAADGGVLAIAKCPSRDLLLRETQSRLSRSPY